MSELARGSERWVRDAAGERWRVELAPPEPILGAGLGIAPAIQDPALRTTRLRFTPESAARDTLWSDEEFAPGVEIESFSDADLLDHLRRAGAG